MIARGGKHDQTEAREPQEVQKLLTLEKERIGLRRRGWVDDEDDTPLRLPLLERRRPVNGVLVRFCQ